MSYHGATVKLKIERILAEGMIQKEFIGIGDGAGDDEFHTKNFPIVDPAAKPGGVVAEVAANAPTDTVFKTTLPSTVEDYYTGMTLRFTTGPLAAANEMGGVLLYAQATKQITMTGAFVGGAPGVGDDFIIEPSVNVYTDQTTPGSWHELDEDGLEYQIDGLTGLVTILAAANNVDERYSIDYYTSAEVGLGQSASIDFEGSLEDVYTLGSRNPQEVKEGQISIGGTIDQLYCTRDLIGKFLGERDFYGLLTDFSFYLYPNKEVVGQPQIKLSNVKFGGGSISVDVGGIMAANVTFKGLVIAVGVVPAP